MQPQPKDPLKPKINLPKTPKKRKPVLLYGLLYFFSLIIIIAGVGYLYYKSMGTTVNTQEVTIDIPKGSNSDKVADLLESQGVLKNDLYFKLQSIRTGLGEDFKAGRYIIPPKQSVDTLMKRIADGDNVKLKTIKVTIPEGYTIEQVAARLENSKLISKDAFLKEAYNWNGTESFLTGIPVDQHRLDGFLYPETYEFYEGATANEIITTMLKQFGKVWATYSTDFANQKLSVREVITLASLVEKEAKHDEDRPKIAGVIQNRLKQDMLLQIDATVLFAVGHKDKVTYDDLEVDSPYNTYKYKGLPPSAIANPGKKSIDAALHPEQSDYLYYVADKETGYHHFAKTLKEHNKNIAKYLK